MNTKKLLLITALVCASPIISAATSAEVMYKDLVESVLSKYPRVGPQAKAWDISGLQRQLCDYRDSLQNEIVSRYATKINGQYKELGFTFLGLTSISGIMAAVANYYPQNELDNIIFGPAFLGVAGVSLGMSMYCFVENNRHIKLCKNKIKDINEVLVKLDGLKKELYKEHQEQNEMIPVPFATF